MMLRCLILPLIIFGGPWSHAARRRKKCRGEVIRFDGRGPVAEGSPHFKNLIRCTYLDLMATGVGDNGILQIARAIKLQRKELRHLVTIHAPENGLTDVSVTSLASAISSHSALYIRELYLQRNQIGDSVGIALGNMLKKISSLELLSLTGNKDFGDRGAVGLSSGIALNRELKKLHLQMTSISDVGAVALADALNREKGSVSRLQQIDLAHLSGVGLAAATALAAAVGGGALKDLRMDHTGIGADGAMALFRALGSPRCELEALSLNNVGNLGEALTVTALAAGMASNKYLTSLQLMGSLLSDTGFELIVQALTSNAASRLTHLNLANNAIGDVGASAAATHIRAAPRPLETLRVLDLQQNRLTAAGMESLACLADREVALSVQIVTLSGNPGTQTDEGRAAAARLERLLEQAERRPSKEMRTEL